MNELKIEYLPVDSLTPYEGNARKHAPDDIESIKLSQMKMAEILNDPDTGQRLYRAFRSGNCSLAYFLRWAKANGFRVYFGMCRDVDGTERR